MPEDLWDRDLGSVMTNIDHRLSLATKTMCVAISPGLCCAGEGNFDDPSTTSAGIQNGTVVEAALVALLNGDCDYFTVHLVPQVLIQQLQESRVLDCSNDFRLGPINKFPGLARRVGAGIENVPKCGRARAIGDCLRTGMYSKTRGWSCASFGQKISRNACASHLPIWCARNAVMLPRKETP